MFVCVCRLVRRFRTLGYFKRGAAAEWPSSTVVLYYENIIEDERWVRRSKTGADHDG